MEKFASPCPEQTKESLEKFLESLMNQSGKLISLIRDLQTKYVRDATTTKPLVLQLYAQCIYVTLPRPYSHLRSITDLETQVKCIEAEFDKLNDTKVQAQMMGLTEAKPSPGLESRYSLL